MNSRVISKQYQDKIDELPDIQGFGAPQQGFIRGNLASDKKTYKTLGEAYRAAKATPECTGFTSLPTGGWSLRIGTYVKTNVGSIRHMDVSFLKVQYHQPQRDDL